MAFACLLMASCMGDGYADSDGTKDDKVTAIGNNKLEATNVITIAQLKEKYATTISSSTYTQVEDDIKILGIVTGNDEGGNLYNEVSLQDSTGAILVCISKGGLYGELPVGQQVLIDCKGLYIGGYGKQAELGGIYTNSSTGNQSIGKMDRYVWEQHYKIIGTADASKAEALREIFDVTKIKNEDYLASCAGKLMTIEGVTFASTTHSVYAYDGDKDNANCVSRALDDVSSNNLVVRTSAYAKFANDPLPTTPQNITGIFTRYRNVWQILIRTSSDVSSAKGTVQLPYTVTEALNLINTGTYSSKQVYTQGVIAKIDDVSTTYGNANYYISVDGKDSNTIKVFRGYYLNGDKFTEDTKSQLTVGKKVVIYGKLTLYNDTPEIDSGNYIYSIK